MDRAFADVADAKPVPPPLVQLNPAARIAYTLTLRFDKLPTPIAKIEALARFKVGNLNCVPTDYTRAPGGVKLAPEHAVPLNLQRVNDTTYTATFYTDALLDEDYYKLSVCRWALQTASVDFYSPTTRFVGHLWESEMRVQQSKVLHYLARDFTQKPALYDVVFGERPGHYLPSMGPEFTLTLTAHKAPAP